MPTISVFRQANVSVLPKPSQTPNYELPREIQKLFIRCKR